MHGKRRAISTGVRIVGGRWRGRQLAIPAGTEVRPTPDRVRETLFNWLAASLPGARCLDLFAGTGVLGLEALSRGASHAWFVERDAVLVQALRARTRELEAEARVSRRDVLELLASPPMQRFDVVFVDPPYAMDVAAVLMQLAVWVAPQHRIYIERPVERDGRTIEGLIAAVPGARILKTNRAAGVAYGLIRLAARE